MKCSTRPCVKKRKLHIDGITLSKVTPWQHSRSEQELHLYSGKDNQATGVFNLDYACWTINHFIELRYIAQTRGEMRSSPWQARTSPLSCFDVPLLQRECPLLIQFFWGARRAELHSRPTVMCCTSSVSSQEMVLLFELAVTSGCWNAPGGMLSQVLQSEFELQLSAPVYQRGDAGLWWEL